MYILCVYISTCLRGSRGEGASARRCGVAETDAGPPERASITIIRIISIIIITITIMMITIIIIIVITADLPLAVSSRDFDSQEKTN